MTNTSCHHLHSSHCVGTRTLHLNINTTWMNIFCLHIYVYVYIYIYVLAYVFIHLYVRQPLTATFWTYIYLYIYICTFTHIYVYICMTATDCHLLDLAYCVRLHHDLWRRPFGACCNCVEVWCKYVAVCQRVYLARPWFMERLFWCVLQVCCSVSTWQWVNVYVCLDYHLWRGYCSAYCNLLPVCFSVCLSRTMTYEQGASVRVSVFQYVNVCVRLDHDLWRGCLGAFCSLLQVCFRMSPCVFGSITVYFASVRVAVCFSVCLPRPWSMKRVLGCVLQFVANM